MKPPETVENAQSPVSAREEEVLAFWREHRIFEQSLEKPAPKGEFVFYDGPPFATGLPHYGHILAGTIKDAIPRYKTMRGYRVPRRWGWDCHGLPLENEIEKDLGLATKRDIEAYGVGAFNAKARGNVLRYADDWKRIIPRMGRWVDMGNDYKTMDASYTESVWWSFKTLHDKGLIYEGFKAMHLCPRCETTLSNFEVSQGYKDIADLSVVVKLELVDEPGTFLLAWTTTPWTLPGNMAAAVKADARYVRVAVGGERYVVAKERVPVFFKDGEYSVEGEISGAELVGKKYAPPFSYYTNANLKGKECAWKVYAAPFVSLDEGTGIVHVAPAFGAEDLELAEKESIPVVHHVATDGTFKPEVADFAGMPVKPKDDHQSADVAIIKNLAHRNLLFKKEKVTHSYPHCWRCDTPLINYASNSWFVRVTAFKDKLLAENRKTRWVPADIRDGRFGKWLEGARDWAISRTRYWGAPIPVWKDAVTGEMVVMGSVDDLKKHVKKSGNRYFVMRHGEAENNAQGIISSNPSTPHHLTEKGREQIRKVSASLPAIDLIYTSPFVRARETAEIVAEVLGTASVAHDVRLGEVNAGPILEGKDIADYYNFYSSIRERFEKAPPGGESLSDVKRRATEFLYELERTHTNKKILIVTHESAASSLFAGAFGLNVRDAAVLKESRDQFLVNGEARELPFTPLPHNGEYELDLHRPFIDEIELVSATGNPLVRVQGVFDCWFESGSMPYAQSHYPFEEARFKPARWFGKSRGFPADFIAEGVDQTRGWFYSLLVLSVGLFGKSAYKNVIVNGFVLAEDGRKMGKRLKNYPEPMDVVHRYGADALRLYLLASPIMRGEDLRFSEQGVAETMRKNIARLDNVLAFYKLYPGTERARRTSAHVLDRWMLARLDETVAAVTDAFERYELDVAARPVADLVDDLSTWYLRRSRDRFKGGDAADVRATTRFVLRELAKVMAPMTPFFAEHLFRAVREEGEPESVHLADWPTSRTPERGVLDAMARARRAVVVGLEARAKAGVKVRQPLASFETTEALSPECMPLVADELNVKEVRAGASADGLDTALTPGLVEEGVVREIIRHVQDMRKEAGLSPGNRITLSIGADPLGEILVRKHESRLAGAVLASAVRATPLAGEPVRIGDYTFTFSIQE